MLRNQIKLKKKPVAHLRELKKLNILTLKYTLNEESDECVIFHLM